MKGLNETMARQLEQIYQDSMGRESPGQLAEGSQFEKLNSENHNE
jgi:hypothetical protein